MTHKHYVSKAFLELLKNTTQGLF